MSKWDVFIPGSIRNCTQFQNDTAKNFCGPHEEYDRVCKEMYEYYYACLCAGVRVCVFIHESSRETITHRLSVSINVGESWMDSNATIDEAIQVYRDASIEQLARWK